MRSLIYAPWLILFSLVFVAVAQGQDANPKEPKADRKLDEGSYHGIKRHDYYAWLKAENWQAAVKKPSLLPPKIGAYLKSENQYFNAIMKPNAALQKTLFKELVGRLNQKDNAVPTRDGKYAYFTRQVAGENYAQEVRRPRSKFKSDAAFFSTKPSPFDEVLLDGNKIGKPKPGVALRAVIQSPDHTMIAYGVDFTGSEYYKIKVRDLATGKDLDDEISNSDGYTVWMPNGRGFYYGGKNKNGRTNKVWRHMLGDRQVQDKLIFETDDSKGFSAKFDLTRNKKYLLLSAQNRDYVETYFVDPNNNGQQPKLLAKKEKNLVYSVSSNKDRFYILTNADGAEDFKIMWAPVHSPARENWRELIAYKPGRMIVSMAVYENFLVRFERENGQERLVIRHLSDGNEHVVKFDDEVYDLNYWTGYEFSSDMIRVTYSSPVRPVSVYDYNMKTRKLVLRKRQTVPSGHNPENYITKREFVTGHDGVKVPVTLLYHKDTALDGSAPVFLSGYGAYGSTTYTPFQINAFSLVNRGFIYARAHPRGGKEKGWKWYKDGRRDKKINTYKDFISVANYLIEKRYTSAGKIVAYGISAGGMIMGYIANETRGIFGAIVADVPFVDVLNTMLDKSLPLTPEEWPEWGDPISDVKAFKYIASYSPYDNVKEKAYPAMMVLASISDIRVTYWEPAKWVAKLRAKRTNKEKLILRIDMGAGHSGSSGRFIAMGKVAMVYAFALDVMGLKNAAIMKID